MSPPRIPNCLALSLSQGWSKSPKSSLQGGSDQESYCRQLPDDVLLVVLFFADLPSLSACRRVCRRWDYLVMTDISLQYNMELGAYGMANGLLQAGDIVAERLDRLRLYHSQWMCGAFDANRFIPRHPAVGTPWIAQHSCDGSVLWYTRSEFSTEIVVHFPPSKLRGLQEHSRTVELENPGGQPIRVVTDIMQNLLVTVERPPDSSDIIVSMLSLEAAGRAPHPDAAPPIVLVGPRQKGGRDPSLDVSIHDITVCGRYIAWYIISCSNNLEVWDWTTGQLVWLRKFKSVSFYTFLDPWYLAVVDRAYSSREHIEIYHFASLNRESDGTLLPSQAHSMNQSNHVCDLQLPPPKDASMQTFTGHLACYTTRLATASVVRVPFRHDPASAVLAVQYSIRPSNGSVNRCFELLIPLRTIYRQIGLALARRAFRPSDTVKWIHWGPGGSLLLHRGQPSRLPQPTSYLSFTPFGHHYPVLLYDQESPDRCGRVLVLDFSRDAIRRTHGRFPRGEGVKMLASVGAFQGSWEEDFATTVRSKLAFDVIVGPHVTFPEPSNYPWTLRMQPDGFSLLYVGYPGNDNHTLGLQSFSI